MRSSVSQTPSPWEDVPMDEEAVLVVPRKVDKGKSRAGEEQGVKKKTRPRPMEKKVPSTQPTIGTKRELSNSPSKEDGPSTSTKKRRGGKARSFLAGGLDLGVITVNEGAPVDTTMVPLAKQRVSSLLGQSYTYCSHPLRYALAVNLGMVRARVACRNGVAARRESTSNARNARIESKGAASAPSTLESKYGQS